MKIIAYIICFFVFFPIYATSSDFQSEFEKGTYLASKGLFEEAIVAFSNAIKLNPKNATAYSNRAAIYSRQENYKKAIEDSNKAIELDPSDSTAYFNRGNEYFSLGDPQKAIKDFDKAISINPKFAAAYSNRGNTYFSIGNSEQALIDFKVAAKFGEVNAQQYLKSQGIAW